MFRKFAGIDSLFDVVSMVGLQPLGTRALSVVPFLNFVLTSLSLRLFGLLYATSGGLLNISANRSFY